MTSDRRAFLTSATAGALLIGCASGPIAAPKLVLAVHSFNHMYGAHAAREDTVVFPALRSLMSSHEYDELREQFEARETKMLGDHGFEHAVEAVAKLEQAFGVDDLAKLTA
jgi:hypothetical protein